MNKCKSNIARIIFLLVCILMKPSVEMFLTEKANNIKGHTVQEIVDLAVDLTDEAGPRNIIDALVNATTSSDTSLNQYCAPIGLGRLRKAIAKLYTKVTNIKLDPEKNVLVTVGATEALFSSILAFTSPGDEWIIIEPYFFKFSLMVKQAHGVPRFTSLKLKKNYGQIRSTDWTINKKKLEILFNNRTKGIIFNNPNNPTGKVYTREEVQFIADLVKKKNVLLLSDEAHEWIIYEPNKLVRIATLPGMYKRTITIGSASKSFSLSGWRIGWAYGPADLIKQINAVHDNVIGNSPTPQQEAIGYAFEQEFANFGKPESHFIKKIQRTAYQRDLFIKKVIQAGMQPIIPDCCYCLLADWPALTISRANWTVQEGHSVSEKFSNWMEREIGVLTHPLSNFYSDDYEDLGQSYVRFCFQKKDETIRRAGNNLLRLKNFL